MWTTFKTDPWKLFSWTYTRLTCTFGKLHWCVIFSVYPGVHPVVYLTELTFITSGWTCAVVTETESSCYIIVTRWSMTMTVTIYKHKHLFFKHHGYINTLRFCFEQWHVNCEVFCTSSGHIWVCASSLFLPSTGWGWKLSWPQVRCSWRF